MIDNFDISEPVLVVVEARDSFKGVEDEQNRSHIGVNLHVCLLVPLFEVVKKRGWIQLVDLDHVGNSLLG